MIYKIRITKTAQTDMRGIYKYIADDLHNPDAASRRIMLIDETIKSLAENPARFPRVRDSYLASKGYRVAVVKTHLILFIIRDKTMSVSVMRVLYGRRDWFRILKGAQ